jgi:CelD/BcsL family acetyltransferase involved in cellulose biosynthesis
MRPRGAPPIFHKFKQGLAMTMAAAIESQSASTPSGPTSLRIARIDILHDVDAAETAWRALEADDQFSTPYQRFDFLKAWQANVGVSEDLQPFIVVATSADGKPLLLLPLAMGRENGANVVRFLGGKHTTFNMGLWQRDFASSVTKADLDTVLSAIHDHGADVLAFTQQPRSWMGLANPMTLLPGQPSPNACPLMVLSHTSPENKISTGFRRRMRTKERKLQAMSGYRYQLAQTDEEIERLLNAFFLIKPQRMAAQKLPNIFADPAVEKFIRESCLAKLPNGRRAIEIHALECDAEVIAIFAGVSGNKRFSMMFNTYTMSENARHSPGVILVRSIVDHYAQHNYDSFDLGIGSDDYKLQFCKDDEPIFDSFIPLTARGKLAAFGMSSLTHAKRLVKQNPALMQMARRLRGALQH